MDLTPDVTKLTPAQRDQLDLYNMSKSQSEAIKAIEQKMTKFAPEMQMKISNLADLKQDTAPLLDALKAMQDKELEGITTPIVEALDKLEKALGAIDFKPSFIPEVKVDAPQVNVAAPKIDLSGVEKAVKEISKAVKQAISQIPQVEVPETDFSPLLEKLDSVLEQLSDIDKGVRLKPEPGTMKVTNTDGTSINSTVIQGVVSAKNSSTVNLAANGVFTGLGELVKDYASVQVAVYANQASATDGLSIQQSMDGANWDITDVYTIAASTGKTFSVQPASEYLRVVYTNGASAQGAFRLSTVYHVVTPKPSSQRPADAVSNENDLEQTQSFGMTYNGTTWDRMRTDGTTGGVGVGGTVASGVADSGNPVKVGGKYTTTPAALTTGQRSDLNVDQVGNLRTSTYAPGTTNAARFLGDNADGVAVDATAANKQAIMARTTVFNGTSWDRMSGDTTGINIKNIVGTIVPGTGATNLGKAEDAAHVTGDTGVAMLGVRDDTLNATSGTEGDYEMLHTTAEGALWVTQAPSITNGWSTFNATSGDGSTALTSTAQQVKGSAGTVGGWYIYNPNSSVAYVNFYNATSASVTVGTTNQQFPLAIPATSAANIEFGNGITFSTAISISATTTGGGNTAPATALEAVIFWK